MAIREVIKVGDPLLTKKCHKVTKFDTKLASILDDMKETMVASNGVGLAGPQIGIIRRIAVVLDVNKEEEGTEPVFYEFVNPEVIWESDEKINDAEGCISVPGVYGKVLRPARARVRAQNRNGEFYEVEGSGIVARCFCHEVEHLDGHIFTEKVTEYIKPEEIE